MRSQIKKKFLSRSDLIYNDLKKKVNKEMKTISLIINNSNSLKSQELDDKETEDSYIANSKIIMIFNPKMKALMFCKMINREALIPFSYLINTLFKQEDVIHINYI